MCVCVCVCGCGGLGGGVKRATDYSSKSGVHIKFTFLVTMFCTADIKFLENILAQSATCFTAYVPFRKSIFLI